VNGGSGATARDAGFAEDSLPRANGTVVFDAPWQARAHALAVLVVEATGGEWDGFRRQLIIAVAEEPTRPYWESWMAALDRFVDAQLPDLPASDDAAWSDGQGQEDTR
jgi:hypothetical protein